MGRPEASPCRFHTVRHGGLEGLGAVTPNGPVIVRFKGFPVPSGLRLGLGSVEDRFGVAAQGPGCLATSGPSCSCRACSRADSSAATGDAGRPSECVEGHRPHAEWTLNATLTRQNTSAVPELLFSLRPTPQTTSSIRLHGFYKSTSQTAYPRISKTRKTDAETPKPKTPKPKP